MDMVNGLGLRKIKASRHKAVYQSTREKKLGMAMAAHKAPATAERAQAPSVMGFARWE